MTIRLVNTLPGDLTDPVVPGAPLHIGLKSTNLTIDPGSLRVDVGFTGVTSTAGFLPENSPFLILGATVATQAPENAIPKAAAMSSALSPNLVINKTTNSNFDASVYAVKVPLGERSIPSSMAYFKFRFKSAWTRSTPQWADRSQMAPPFFCLEHGPLNTSLTVNLWDDGGTGSVLIGGPQPELSTARTNQHTFPFAWTGLIDGAVIELWLFFNLYANPFRAEVWGKLPTDTSPQVLGSFNNFKTFPTPGGVATNTRTGPSPYITAYFGNGGRTGDVLQIDDWAVYPDYRICVMNGEALPDTKFVILPDSPVSYNASMSAQRLDQLVPGRWCPLDIVSNPSVALPIEMQYQPGRSTQPVYASMTANGHRGGFQKKEPRIESLSDGVMIEAFLAAASTARVGICTSLGIGFEDGVKSYRLMLLDTQNYRTIGFLEFEGFADAVTGYSLVGSEIDWTSLRPIRLTLDRLRNEICVFGEDMDEPALILPTGSTTIPPASLSTGRFIIGSLTDLPAAGRLDVSNLLYLPKYRSWEGRDVANKKPDDPSFNSNVRFTEYSALDSLGSTAMSSGYLTITKSSFNLGSYRLYSLPQDLGEVKGFLADFKVIVDSYAGSTSDTASNTDTGLGLRFYLGNKVVQVGFFDCGIYGRKVGIIPGSGSANDIINQTPLGRNFSVSADWFTELSYRLVVKGFDSIQLWVGTTIGPPAIEISWRNDLDGFDLPNDTSPAGIEFGHFNQITSSVSRWRYLRWGISNGYETAIQPLFPQGEPDYLFGGRVEERIVVTDG